MERLISYTPYIAAGAGMWALANGILHDVFVLSSEHVRQYDRNLLRLLMDGHILITCGLVLMLSYNGIKAGHTMALYIALVAALSLLVYCALIWPFLRSVVTMLISFACSLFIIASIIRNHINT